MVFLHISELWISIILEMLERQGPKNDEDPLNKILKILDMTSISTRKHGWDFGSMVPISTTKHKMEFW